MPDYFLFEEDRDPMEILDITTGDAWDKWDAGYRLRALEISPDGNVFLTVGRDDFILRFWDAQSGEELSAMGTLENVSDASFSPDGSLVLIETPPSSGGRDVVFWDVASGETVGVLQGHTQLYDPRFSDDMTLLTVQSTGRRLIVYGIQQQ
jgi:WD40 repeat protein